MATLASTVTATHSTAKAEMWLGYAAKTLTVCAGLAILLHLVSLVWAQNEFTQPESIVAVQSNMFAHEGYLYGSLKDYPYTVNAYMPIFYLLEAGLIRVGVPMPLGARLISFVSLLGIITVLWRMVLLYTNDRRCAHTAALLCATTSLVLQWGTTGQVDTLATFLTLASFYTFSRYWVKDEATIAAAALLAAAGLLVKQTVLPAPTAIFLLLLSRSPKQALRFAAILSTVLLPIVLAINAWTHGGFLANTVFANINPFALYKLKQHTDFMLLFAGQLILVTGVCATQIWNTHARALLVYLGLAACVLALTASKIGSDSNYQIETTILLAATAACGLHAVNFFPRFFSGDKALLTLLHLPLGVHMVLNLRLMYPVLLARVIKEQAFREQITEVSPLIGSDRAIIADSNTALHTKGHLDVEPLIYTLLVEGGRIDPERLRRDLGEKKFGTLVLYTDVNRPEDLDPEIPRLTEAQNEQIRQNYALVSHVPGPYMNGLFVYRAKGNSQ